MTVNEDMMNDGEGIAEGESDERGRKAKRFHPTISKVRRSMVSQGSPFWASRKGKIE